MKSWYAVYDAGGGAEPAEATVLASEKQISIGLQEDGKPVILQWYTRDTVAVFDSSAQASRLTNSSDRKVKLTVTGKEAFDFITHLKEEQNKPWHKKDRTREWVRNSFLFLGIAGILVAVYFLMVPWLAAKAASAVSVQTEEQFGNTVYDQLALSWQEDTAATAVVNDFFREMQVPSDYTIRITVVKSSVVNAFALPGGRIVIFTGLLRQLKTYPELAALLGHEFTHVNNQHATRSVFRKLGSRVFIALLFGRIGSVTSVLASQADNLKSLTYSRKLEREADEKGLLLLKQRNIDPDGFVRMFQRLKTSEPADQTPEFLASHPDIDKRIASIRSSAAGAEVKENIRLKAIFDQLNKQP